MQIESGCMLLVMEYFVNSFLSMVLFESVI